MVKRRNKHREMFKKILIFFMIVFLSIISILNIPKLERIFYPFPHRTIIEEYATQYGVDPLLVAAVIREESKFFPKSTSPKGAKGLMQLMPNTAKAIAESIGDKTYSEDKLLDPEKNIQYGTWYIASLQKVFSNNIFLVTAAYNGGRGHVQEWIKNGQIDANNVCLEDIPFKETRDYVGRVLKSYDKYIQFYRK